MMSPATGSASLAIPTFAESTHSTFRVPSSSAHFPPSSVTYGPSPPSLRIWVGLVEKIEAFSGFEIMTIITFTSCAIESTRDPFGSLCLYGGTVTISLLTDCK
ncbi:hypothetical protein TorRG33x02_283140 [Trema orientale]|uniref:Uncharacterized protein n=1 Tax=Trema orientale TaxID=63057 RepID=A0A2P5CJ20_TREOI|nr:hypothetical protein TorRG33x02_283140 [Trema orientale]